VVEVYFPKEGCGACLACAKKDRTSQIKNFVKMKFLKGDSPADIICGLLPTRDCSLPW